MKNHFITSIAFFLFLGFTLTSLKAQDYSGLKPIQDFHRHNATGPLFAPSAVLTNDTLAWVRFRGLLPGGKYQTGANIMSWVTGPVTNNSFPANLVFRTGDHMRMTIRDNGFVGVNTFLPEALFTVSDPLSPVIRFDRSDPGERDFEIYAGANGNLLFRGGSNNSGPSLPPPPLTNFMTLTWQGRLGVGANAPDQLLTLSDEATGALPALRFDRSAGGRDFEVFTNSDGNLLFRGGADGVGPALTNRMVITHEGRVGIGTDAPDQALTLSDETAGALPLLRFDRSAAGGRDFEIFSDNSGSLMFRGGADNTGTPATPLNHLVTITHQGMVGIGTLTPFRELHVAGDALVTSDLQVDGIARIGNITAPGGIGAHRFAVGGSIVCHEVKVALQGNWPDYVFEDNYQMMPLEEVKEFISENRHLPGIPSAQEVSEKGLSLGQMQALTMEKMEELFLHVIELSEKVKALEAENAALRELIRK